MDAQKEYKIEKLIGDSFDQSFKTVVNQSMFDVHSLFIENFTGTNDQQKPIKFVRMTIKSRSGRSYFWFHPEDENQLTIEMKDVNV